jgi:hypothetical protein
MMGMMIMIMTMIVMMRIRSNEIGSCCLDQNVGDAQVKLKKSTELLMIMMMTIWRPEEPELSSAFKLK